MWYRNILRLFVFLISSLFLCGIFCEISFASDAHDNFVYKIPAPYDHSIKKDQNSDNQNLTLSNDMFGLSGPFSLRAVYSKLFGITFEGTYTQVLGQKDAALIELDLGGKQRRVAGTWGHVLTSNQLFKVTAENLSQDLDFDFASGKINKWIYQNALGGSYAYLIKNGLLNDINVNAYYSRALSKDLSSVDYVSGNSIFRDFRRIAGGVDKSASAGVHLLPSLTTLVGIQANYDNVSYKMKNDLSAKRDENGLGATLSLDQLINDHVKFNLLASHRKVYQDYKAELDWLVNSTPGSSLELGLLGERIIGNVGTRNDTQGGINLKYTWGGSLTSKPMLYEVPKADTGIAGLRDWVSNPAVRMDQVLALKDERIEFIRNTATPSPNMTATNGNEIEVHPGEAKHIDITQYFASKTDDKNANKIQYKTKSLPNIPGVAYQDGKLTIDKNSFTKKDVGKEIKIDFEPTNINSIPSLSMVSLVLKVEDPSMFPQANQYYIDHPITIYATVGQFYDKQSFTEEPQTQENQLIINHDPDLPENDLNFRFYGLNDLDLTDSERGITRSEGIGLYFIITFSGTPQLKDIGVHKIDLYGSNLFGSCKQPLTITMIIGAKPTITVPTLTFAYKKTVDEDITQYFKSTPGYDLEEVAADLSEYGLKLNFDASSQKITITGTPTKTTETERTIPISAKNRFGQTDSNFKLDILSPPIKLKDIGDKTGGIGKYITPIPLGVYFEIPTGSPEINGWDIEAKSQDGKIDIKGLDQIKSYFGLTVKDNFLQGKLNDIKEHTPYTFYISAKNDAGESIDKDGNAAFATMNLNIAAKNTRFYPYVNQYYVDHPITIYATVGQIYNKVSFTEEPQTFSNQLIINPAPDIADMDWGDAFTGFENLGIVPNAEFKKIPGKESWPFSNYYVLTYSTLQGIPESAVGNHTVYMRPSNDAGPSETSLAITIIIGAKPTITVPTLTFAYKKTVDEDITQYFKSTPGYDLEEVAADLSEYGLKLNFDASSQKITITGTPTKTTETERTIPISAKNRFGQTDSNFKLDILSPPIKLKDIGDKTGQVGKYITPIPLSNYFEIPTGSPEINGWDIEAKSQDGKVDIKGLDQIKSYFGLTVKDNFLQGKLNDIKEHTPYTFYISAKNDAGESIDKDGNASSATMNLTVLAENEN